MTLLILNFKFSILNFLKLHGFKNVFQAVLVGDKYLTGFTTLEWPHDACRFQLVDDSSCPVVADGETSLDRGG